jgi:hypothetical protein
MTTNTISINDTNLVQVRLIEVRDAGHITVNDRHFALKAGEIGNITHHGSFRQMRLWRIRWVDALEVFTKRPSNPTGRVERVYCLGSCLLTKAA